MEEVFATFVSVQTLLLSLGTYVLVFSLRRVTEALWRDLKSKRFHRELMLPLMPVIVGGALGAVATAWAPEAVGATMGARALYGAICGQLSGHVYGRIKSWINSRPGVNS